MVNDIINGFNINDNVINVKYIVLPGEKDTTEKMNNLVLSGRKSIEDVLRVSNYCLLMNELLRPCQGIEIDGAKTGVYAEIIEEMEITLRSYHARFCTMLKTAYMSTNDERKFFENDNVVYSDSKQVLLTYHSLSPLGYLCRYCRLRGQKLLKGLDNLNGRDMLKQLSLYNKDRLLSLYKLMVNSVDENGQSCKVRLIDRITEIKGMYGAAMKEVVAINRKIDDIRRIYANSIISKAYDAENIEKLEKLNEERRAKTKEVVDNTVGELLALKDMIVANKPDFDVDTIPFGCYVASYINNTDNRKESFAYLLNNLQSINRIEGLNLIRLPACKTKYNRVLAVKNFINIDGNMTHIKCLKSFGPMETIVVDGEVFAIDDCLNSNNPYSLSDGNGMDSQHTVKIVLKPAKAIFANGKLTDEQKEYNNKVMSEMIEMAMNAKSLSIRLDKDSFGRVSLFDNNNDTAIAEVDFVKTDKLASKNLLNMATMLALVDKNIAIKNVEAGKFGRISTAEVFVR